MRKRPIHRHAPRAIGYDPRVLLGKPEGFPSLSEALDVVSQVGPVVYAMRLRGDVIKIGHSGRLGRRRIQLQGTMLAFRFGTRDDEQAIHALLAEHRHHGREYYHPTPEVLAVVNEMREALALEPV